MKLGGGAQTPGANMVKLAGVCRTPGANIVELGVGCATPSAKHHAETSGPLANLAVLLPWNQSGWYSHHRVFL